MAAIWGQANMEDLKLIEKCISKAGRLILKKKKKTKYVMRSPPLLKGSFRVIYLLRILKYFKDSIIDAYF